MIRIKVCKLSEIINTLVLFWVYIFVFIFFIKLSVLISENIDFSMAKIFIINNFTYLEKEYININKNSFFEELIFSQIPKIRKANLVYEKNINNKNKENEISYIQDINIVNIKEELLVAKKISETKVQVGSVRIENYTKKELNYDELAKALNTSIFKKDKILIYHTHASESYSDIEVYSDYYRTTDKENNVVSVGNKLVEELAKYGMYAKQDTTLHDYASYGKAYEASLKTIQKRKNEDDYKILIDIHRDALAANETYRPTAEINGETVAKLMLVVGTNTAGLKHDEWIENLKFAIAIQERANRMYPGLFRDIHLSTSRYNQHMANKAIILEVGATGNTIEEAQASMKYFASVLNSMI